MQANNNITYTQVVTNAGPSAATTRDSDGALPANTTFVSLTGPGRMDLHAGDTYLHRSEPCATVRLQLSPYVVKVNAGTAAGTAINDTVTVSFRDHRSELCE